MNAITHRMPENINLLTDIKFSVSIQRLPTVQYFCQVVNVPGCHLPMVVQPTSFIPQQIQGDTLHYDTLRFSFLVDEYLNNYWSIYKWMKGITFPDTHDQYKYLQEARRPGAPRRPDFGDLYSDITLNILSSKSNMICLVHYRECFPIKLEQMVFDTTRLDSDPIQCSVEFGFTSFEYEQLNPVEGVGSAESVI